MLAQAFPQTPWVFLYRDPVETVWSFMSVLHDVLNPAGIYCVRNQRKALVSGRASAHACTVRWRDGASASRRHHPRC